MEKLKQFYDARVASLGETEFLSQVGHTLSGKSLGAETVDLMVSELRTALAPGPDDHVLDLCCGNGVFSRRLAKHAASVTGVDLSPELIRIATSYNAADNIRYFQGDVSGLGKIGALRDRRYARIVMNASLQHFHPNRFGEILEQILGLADDAPVVVFSNVPENGKQKYLFDSWRKRLKRLWLRTTGRDIFGHWWDRQIFERAAERHGLSCDFPPLDPRDPYAAYRMTVRLAG